MPVVNEYAAGAPCWFELGTTDQDAAKRFYVELFGWDLSDSPIGENQTYTIFRKNERDVCAAYTLEQKVLAQGVPPHWNVYFATANADATADKAVELGGKTVQKPFDVMDAGRMAILQDPGGATFFAWQAKKNAGAGVIGEDNTVCWSELATWNVPQARDFYTNLFGWATKGAQNMATYLEFNVDGRPSGGLLPMDEKWGEAPSYWGIYFMVADCDAIAEKAKQLGAAVRMGPFSAPGVGRLATLTDPQGAAFSIIKLEAQPV